MERRMGDSLLRWLGRNKPPQHRVRHEVWKKQLNDRTRRPLLGVDRSRQRNDLEMLNDPDKVRVVEAAGARLEAAGAGPESEPWSGDEEGWVEVWVGGLGYR